MTTSRHKLLHLEVRTQCFLIGFLTLLACVVDIVCHAFIVSITTNGFQCDVTEERIRQIDFPWLEPTLLIINIGTHGLYPFPLAITRHDVGSHEYRPKCYPGIFHVHTTDIVNFLINVVWLHFVKSFLCAVFKKDPEPMRMFFAMNVMRLMLQILYFGQAADFRSLYFPEIYWALKTMDITIGLYVLLTIYRYITVLADERMEKTTKVIELPPLPPSYIESLAGLDPKTKDSIIRVKKNVKDAVVTKTKSDSNVNSEV